jgi:transcriptional regulator with XRE-family HTH domain
MGKERRMPANTFGNLLKRLRQRTGKTSRDFCLEHGLDPGNYSRLERGRFPPPQREDLLEKYATALGLVRGSEEWIEFFDVAAACKGQLPRDLLEDDELLAKLPVLFRTLRGSPIAPESLDELIEKIRRA